MEIAHLHSLATHAISSPQGDTVQVLFRRNVPVFFRRNVPVFFRERRCAAGASVIWKTTLLRNDINK